MRYTLKMLTTSLFLSNVAFCANIPFEDQNLNAGFYGAPNFTSDEHFDQENNQPVERFSINENEAKSDNLLKFMNSFKLQTNYTDFKTIVMNLCLESSHELRYSRRAKDLLKKQEIDKIYKFLSNLPDENVARIEFGKNSFYEFLGVGDVLKDIKLKGHFSSVAWNIDNKGSFVFMAKLQDGNSLEYGACKKYLNNFLTSKDSVVSGTANEIVNLISDEELSVVVPFKVKFNSYLDRSVEEYITNYTNVINEFVSQIDINEFMQHLEVALRENGIDVSAIAAKKYDFLNCDLVSLRLKDSGNPLIPEKMRYFAEDVLWNFSKIKKMPFFGFVRVREGLSDEKYSALKNYINGLQVAKDSVLQSVKKFILDSMKEKNYEFMIPYVFSDSEFAGFIDQIKKEYPQIILENNEILPEINDDVVQPEVVENSDVAQPIVVNDAEAANDAKVAQPEVVESTEVAQSIVVESTEAAQPEIVENVEVAQPEVVENAEVVQPEVVENGDLAQSEIVNDQKMAQSTVEENGEVAQPEVVDSAKMAQSEVVVDVEVAQPTVVTNGDATQHEVAENGEVARPTVVENIGASQPTVVENIEVVQPAVVESTEAAQPEVVKVQEMVQPIVEESAEMTQSEVEHDTGVIQSEIVESTEAAQPTVVKNIGAVRSAVDGNAETIQPEVANDQEMIQLAVVKNTETAQPEVANDQEVTQPAVVKNAETTQVVGEENVEVLQPTIVENSDIAQPTVVNDQEIAQPKIAENVDVAQPIVVNDAEVVQPVVVESTEAAQPEIVNSDKMVNDVEAAQPEFVENTEAAQAEVENDVEVVHDAEVAQPEVVENIEVEQSTVVESTEAAQPEVGKNAEVTQPIVVENAEVMQSKVVDHSTVVKDEEKQVYVLDVNETVDNEIQSQIVQKNDTPVKIVEQNAVELSSDATANNQSPKTQSPVATPVHTPVKKMTQPGVVPSGASEMKTLQTPINKVSSENFIYKAPEDKISKEISIVDVDEYRKLIRKSLPESDFRALKNDFDDECRNSVKVAHNHSKNAQTLQQYKQKFSIELRNLGAPNEILMRVNKITRYNTVKNVMKDLGL